MRRQRLCLSLVVSQHSSAMHFYWTRTSFPELRELEPSQRKSAWRACSFRPFLHWQTWAAFLSQFILLLIGAFIGLVVDGRLWMLRGDSPVGREALRFPVASVIFCFVGAAFGYIVFTQVYCSMIRPHLKRYLETHNAG